MPDKPEVTPEQITARQEIPIDSVESRPAMNELKDKMEVALGAAHDAANEMRALGVNIDDIKFHLQELDHCLWSGSLPDDVGPVPAQDETKY